MLRSRRSSAARVRVAAFVLCGLLGTQRATADEDDPMWLLFSGRDLWRNGAFAYGGFVFAPGGFEQDGLMLKVVLSGGGYRYRADALGSNVFGAQWGGQIMPGFRIKRGDAELKLFFGMEQQTHRLWPADPGNQLTGTTLGFRFAGELWWETTKQTVVIGDLSLTSIGSGNNGRLAYGHFVLEEMTGGFYVGPEAQYFATDRYHTLRVGAHITSMRVEAYEWSAALGFAQDSDRVRSPYVRLNFGLKR